MNVDFHFTTWKLGFLNISEYPARYGIQMDPSVTERRWQSGKKPVLGLLSTIIRGMERADQESVYHGKIALAHEHNWAPITSTSAREVARTSARRLGHPAWAGCFWFLIASLPPSIIVIFYHSNTAHSTPFKGASYDRTTLSASLKNEIYGQARGVTSSSL